MVFALLVFALFLFLAWAALTVFARPWGLVVAGVLVLLGLIYLASKVDPSSAQTSAAGVIAGVQLVRGWP